MKRAPSPAPAEQTSSSSSSKKQKHEDGKVIKSIEELTNNFCEKFKASNPDPALGSAITPALKACKVLCEVTLPSDLHDHSCKIIDAAGRSFPEQKFPRQHVSKKIFAESFTDAMLIEADDVCDNDVHNRGDGWDYSHPPSSTEVYQHLDGPEIIRVAHLDPSEVIQVVFRASITGGEGILNHPKSGAAEGVVGLPLCANDSMKKIIIPIPDGEDYTWFSSKAGREEVYKALNELFVWTTTTKICKTEIIAPAVRLITHKEGINESKYSWRTESMRKHELDSTDGLAQIDPPFVMFCGRPAISGQSICAECNLLQMTKEQLLQPMVKSGY